MLNVVYAHETAGLDEQQHAEFDRALELKFSEEMTEFERRREEARQLALRSGSLTGPADIRARMETPR